MLALVKCASAQHINENADNSLTKFTLQESTDFRLSAPKTLTRKNTITYMVLWCTTNIITHISDDQPHMNSLVSRSLYSHLAWVLIM